jgi:hypothetical protein
VTGRLSGWRIMLRFKILASTIPLILTGIFAGSGFTPPARPCITLGETSLQIAPGAWQPGLPAELNVRFTDDPALATVRVQIVDDAGVADFAYVDDIAGAEAETCGATAATRFVAMDAATPAGPVIYLSRNGDADYRIFVSSKRFTAREAAALIVGARFGDARITAAAL